MRASCPRGAAVRPPPGGHRARRAGRRAFAGGRLGGAGSPPARPPPPPPTRPAAAAGRRPKSGAGAEAAAGIRNYLDSPDPDSTLRVVARVVDKDYHAAVQDARGASLRRPWVVAMAKPKKAKRPTRTKRRPAKQPPGDGLTVRCQQCGRWMIVLGGAGIRCVSCRRELNK